MLRSNRGIIAFGLILFLVLSGLGTANALWSSQSTVTGTVTAGTMGVTQSGFPQLAVLYASASSTGSSSPAGSSVTAPVTVTNTGTLPASYAFALSAPAGNALAAGSVVRAWPVTAATACTAATTAPAGTSSPTWASSAALTGNLGAAASATATVIYCVRSTWTSAPSNSSMAATLTVTTKSANATWTATQSATAAQSARDTEAPTAPTGLTTADTSGYSTKLSWTSSTDNSAVTAYDLYRIETNTGATATFANVTSPYTDITLKKSTAYSYTLKARDAAGNTSPASGSRGETTLSIDSDYWYRIDVNSNTAYCIDNYGAGTNPGNAVGLWSCSGAVNQQWQFVKTASGNYNIVVKNSDAGDATKRGLGFTITGQTQGLANRDRLELWGLTNVSTRWQVQSLSPTTFAFINVNSGKCVDINANNVGNVQLEQWDCNRGTAQAFRLVKVP